MQHAPAPRDPAASTRNFGLLVLALGLLLGATMVISRGLRLYQWLSWPHGQARYAGASTASSGRSGGAIACSRRYDVVFNGAPASLTTDAPCLVLIGSDPEPGAVVEVAYEAATSTKLLSGTEVFAVGVFDLAMPTLLAAGVGLLLSSRRRS